VGLTLPKIDFDSELAPAGVIWRYALLGSPNLKTKAPLFVKP